LDRIICTFLGLIRADQPNPRLSRKLGFRDARGCDGFSLIVCASLYSGGCGFAAPGSSARRRVYHLRRERLALQEFHDEKADSVLAADAMERADVG